MKKRHYSGEDISWTDIELKKEDVSQLVLKYIYGFLLIYFGTLGTTLLVTSSLHFELYNLSMVFGLFFVCLVPCLTYNVKKRKFMSYLIVIGIFSIFIAIFSRQIIVSGILAVNKIIAEISIPYKLNLGQLNIPDLGVGNTNMILFIFLFAFISSMIIGYTVIVKNNIIIAMIIPVSLIVFLLSFDVIPSTVSIFLVAAYLFGMLSLENKAKLSPNPGIPIIISGIVISIFLIIMILIPKGNYRRAGIFEDMRMWAQTSFSPLKHYDNMSPLRNDEAANGGVSGGDLGKIDRIRYKNITMFELTAPSTGKNQYYRSFYGASYRDNSWGEVASSTNSEYTMLFTNFHNLKVDTNVQTSSLMKIIGSNQTIQNSLGKLGFDYTQNVLKREFSLFYENAPKKYWYLPYGADKSTEQRSSIDGYPQNNSQSYCVANYYTLANSDYTTIGKFVDSYSGNIAEMAKYKLWESEYRKYVYDVYTDLPEDSTESISVLAKKYAVTSEAEKEEYIKAVKKYFDDNFSYTLSPGKVPEGRDFVDYFMNESKKGYCTYFATAATLMFRAAGIPSRYVEGYCVTDNEIKQGDVSRGYLYTQNSGSIVENTYDKYKIPVYDNNAHAWVEIYKDGYGWIPVEVTPGVVYSANQLSNSDKAQPEPEDQTQQDDTEVSSETKTDEVQKSDDASDEMKGYGDLLAFIAVNVGTIISIILGAVLITAIAVWYVIYLKTKRSIENLLSMESGYNNKKQIFLVYQYFTKLCRFIKVEKPEAMDYEEYSKLLKESSSYFAECNINDIMEIVLKARFSNSEAMPDEALIVTKEVAGLRDKVYEKSGWLNKIRFRYLSKL